MNRKQILENAERCVCTEREGDYGSPEDNFKIIADLWSVYLGIEINAEDVSMLMSLLKIARIKTGKPKADNFIDLAGYAACGGEIATTLKCESPLNESKICEFEHPDGCLACQYNCVAEQ